MPRGTMRKCFSIRSGSFLPCGFSQSALAGMLLHFVPRIRDRFEPAVLRVRAAGLERHHERLTCRVHHGVGKEETLPVDPIEDLRADAHPRLGTRLPPRALRRCDRCEQCFGIGLGIRDTQRKSVRRHLAANLPDRARLDKRERLVHERVERCLAGVRRALAVDLRARRFRIRAPVPALRDGSERAIERGAWRSNNGCGTGTPSAFVVGKTVVY